MIYIKKIMLTCFKTRDDYLILILYSLFLIKKKKRATNLRHFFSKKEKKKSLNRFFCCFRIESNYTSFHETTTKKLWIIKDTHQL